MPREITKAQTLHLADALKVFLLDRRIREFLAKHDPKSIEQAKRAIHAIWPEEVLDPAPLQGWGW